MHESSYNPSNIQAKWQKKWKEDKVYTTDLSNSDKKYYCLVMFPYPSGDKLHLGHWYNYGITDSYGRYMRMRGYNVFEPMGFDSFGLPAENYAIKTGVHPKQSIKDNTGKMTEQLSAMGAMWDWDKSVMTSSEKYYKWTQWIFLQLYNKDLAYRKNAPVNWCPGCMTVLANEQVVDNACERCDSTVTKKDLFQWFFKIRDYAENLLDYEGMDWPQKTITMQRNWIGKKKGINITYKIKDSDESLICFTTRPETNFGATFVVISPEHPSVAAITTDEQKSAVEKYAEESKQKSDIDRQNMDRTKTGVFTGSYAINDLTGYEMPVYVADYVLMNFGTGVVVGVPGHDVRDFEFTQAMGDIEVKRVVKSADGDMGPIDSVEKVFEDEGAMVNSEFLDGLHPHEAIPVMMDHMEKMGMGERVTTYRLKDWLISRQRYWGAPIPIVYDPDGNPHPIPEEHLPWTLPEDVEFKPTGTAPLAQSKELVERTEKIFGKGWKPEVDTMDTFVCSSWYFYRYFASDRDDIAFDSETLNKWMPVDMYVGGPEHACMHLLYARFIHHVMRDLGHVDCKEPFKRLVHQGLITKDGAKMSKSKGNVVSPDAFIEKYGSDVFRMYLMFMGPFTQGGDWNDTGITGIARFVDRLWAMIHSDHADSEDDVITPLLHKTIKKVTGDLDALQFNTAISALMEFVNAAKKMPLTKDTKKAIVQLLAPLAPHTAEELFEFLGETSSVFDSTLPAFNASKIVEARIKVAVQVNGKLRATIEINRDSEKDAVLNAAREQQNVARYLEGKELKKEIYVPNKLVSFVV